MSASLRSRAFVATDSAGRYLKQLVSHLGRRLAVVEDGETRRFALTGTGSCLAVPSDRGLDLQAEATDTEGLPRVQDVVGRHLEQFGQRHELVVRWEPVSGS